MQSAREREPDDQDFIARQLAIMVVPQQAFGPSYARLSVDSDSGPISAGAAGSTSSSPWSSAETARPFWLSSVP
jgi:hypothetical protein